MRRIAERAPRAALVGARLVGLVIVLTRVVWVSAGAALANSPTDAVSFNLLRMVLLS